MIRTTLIPLAAGGEAITNALEKHARDGYAPLSTAYIPTLAKDGRPGKGGLFVILGYTGDVPAVKVVKGVVDPKDTLDQPPAQVIVQHLKDGLPVPEIIPAPGPTKTADL
jgi:hypothetical protein